MNSSLKADIRQLKRQLNCAVDEEDYFRAAHLRDEILSLEDKDPVVSIQKQLDRAIEIEDYEVSVQT